jgi:hypothetical protein
MIDVEKVKADVYGRMAEHSKKPISYENEFYRNLIESIVVSVVASVNEESVRLREQWDVAKTEEYHFGDTK